MVLFHIADSGHYILTTCIMYSEDSDLVMDQEFSAFSEKNVRLGKWPIKSFICNTVLGQVIFDKEKIIMTWYSW